MIDVSPMRVGFGPTTVPRPPVLHESLVVFLTIANVPADGVARLHISGSRNDRYS